MPCVRAVLRAVSVPVKVAEFTVTNPVVAVLTVFNVATAQLVSVIVTVGLAVKTTPAA